MKYIKTIFHFLDAIVQSIFDIVVMALGLSTIALLVAVCLPIIIVLYQGHMFMTKLKKEFK
jgi:hypothetical protein